MHSTTLNLVPREEAATDALLQHMTLAEKIGQMTQIEKNSITPEESAAYFLGSILSGGGGNPTPNNPTAWAAMVRAYQDAALTTRLKIPTIYGSDAVHGHSNVYGATIFPHNIGLGATRDADLVRRIAEITARELLATHVHFDFAPAVSVPQDIRWGRIYEGYSEDTALVTELAIAYMLGLQEHNPRVLASVKHYLADGGTAYGTTKPQPWLQGNWQAPEDFFKLDQGDAQVDEATMRAVHLAPYKAAVEAGAQNIMVSFSSWQGVKMHASHYWITEVLKGELGFQGFVISDWMAVSQLYEDYVLSVVTAINAGIDMVMVPYDYKRFINVLTQAVETGDVPMARIDDAVRRILRVKAWLGLFDHPYGQAELQAQVGSPEHRAVAREAVRKSLVLLKNEADTLPIPRTAHLLVAGEGADDLGMQCGGWSIEWQGGSGAITIGTSILDGLRQNATNIAYQADGSFNEKAPYGIVVVGETPYAEGWGDRSNLHLSAENRQLIEKMRGQCDKLIVVMLSGRPLIITDALPLADAWVLAWLPGTEGAGIADVLFGDYPFSGRLSYSYPRDMSQVPLEVLRQSPDGALFPFGYGLS